MRRRFACVLLALLAAAPAARAARRDERVPTRNMPGPVPVAVATPPSYDAAPLRRYPVLYFLHDGQGDEAVLFRQGVMDALDAAMRAGRIPEMIVVCPRGSGTWWVDAQGGARRMAAFLTDDLVPFVDQAYRTRAVRAGRLVAGISMGGYGALRWALEKPVLFTAAGGLSPAIQQLCVPSVAALPFFLRPSLEAVFGADPVANVLRRNDLYQMLLDDPSLAARAPFLLVRCGTEDKYRLAELAGFFGRFASAVGAAHEVRLETGVHDWPYWRRVFPDFAAALAARLPSGEGP
ncbi:MAG TPA: alpha/beta hydrolase-fold protein [Thermoanaerobaculia bacterium]|jgi:S-formylglutathione hydrolase FrmB